MPSKGLLDTSVIIDLESVDTAVLPEVFAVSSITLAELAAGPAAAEDPVERARRQSHVQRIESVLQCVPFDDNAARAYGLIYAAVVKANRKPRRRIADLLIASTALSENLPLYTRNPDDFCDLTDLVEVIAVQARCHVTYQNPTSRQLSAAILNGRM